MTDKRNKTKPTHIYCMLTSRCNLNCRHCYCAADELPQHSQWSRAEAFKLIDEAAELGIKEFTLTGGECMLHPDFFDIYAEIFRQQMRVRRLVTNGFYLDASALDFLASFSSQPELYISFDGIGHHDWLRQMPGLEAKTKATLELACKRGFFVCADMNIWKDSAADLEQSLDYLESIGVSKIQLMRTSESPRWMRLAPQQSIAAEDFIALTKDILLLYQRKNYSFDLDIWAYIFVSNKKRQILGKEFSAAFGHALKALHTCPSILNRIDIGADGQVYPCDMMSGHYLELGLSTLNVKTEGLAAYFAADEEPLGRTEVFFQEQSPCSSCDYLRRCRGACRAHAAVLTGRYGKNPLTAPSPLACAWWKEGLRDWVQSQFSGYKTNDDYLSDSEKNLQKLLEDLQAGPKAMAASL